MRIAIASSGLGHVARGIETWAHSLAEALHGRGATVTLFAAGPVPGAIPVAVVPCLRRGSPLNRLLPRVMPAFCWRWGLKDGYSVEQRTFWPGLRRRLVAGQYDILHTQDPLLADCARRALDAGRQPARVLLAHGTEEPAAFLAPFDYVQHLAPWHLEQTRRAITVARPGWTTIPNFVDTDRFRPAAEVTEAAACRRVFGLPETGCLVGTAAAIKRNHKRIDYLIREFARATAQAPVPLHLVIAGACHPDLPALRAQAEHECPGRISFRPDVPHDHMPTLLRGLDVFVLASVFEMMPIAVLEALASGLPVIAHRHPVLDWMTGPGGQGVDMTQPDALAAALGGMAAGDRRRLGAPARDHAVRHFSVDAVIPQYLAWYRDACQKPSARVTL